MENKEFNNNLINGKESGYIFLSSTCVAFIIGVLMAVILALIVSFSSVSSEEFMDSKAFFYLSNGLLQFSFVGIIFCFGKIFNKNYFKNVPLKKIKWYDYLLISLLAVCLIFGVGQLNNFFNKFLRILGLKKVSVTVPVPSSLPELLLSAIIVCLLPAFCEELLFRGVILNHLKEYGNLFAIISSGLLFSLFHQSPLQTLHPFLTGMTFAFLVIKTGSILSSILLHFLNNLIIVLCKYFNLFQTFTFVAFIIALTIFVVVILAYVFLLHKTEKKDEEKSKLSFRIKDFLKSYILGIILCVIVYAVEFIG